LEHRAKNGFSLITELLYIVENSAETKSKKGKIKVQSFLRNNKMVLQIRDNGVGMTTEKDKEKEGALGMTLVNKFVAQLNGEVLFETKAGTTVTVTVPI
jgi:two-component sensor histidine kinase